ncbi:MAG: hypothetical protein QXR19_10655 [Candidatus Jordarchaeaceae archaeon]
MPKVGKVSVWVTPFPIHMHIFIENIVTHNFELAPLIFEPSLRLRSTPMRYPHSNYASKEIIKYGKGRRKKQPRPTAPPVQGLRKNLLRPCREPPTTGSTAQHRPKNFIKALHTPPHIATQHRGRNIHKAGRNRRTEREKSGKRSGQGKNAIPQEASKTRQ